MVRGCGQTCRKCGRLGTIAESGCLSRRTDAVVERADGDSRVGQLWSVDLSRGVFSRINPGVASDVAPALSGDGRLAFTLVSRGSSSIGDLYRRAINGSGEPELFMSRRP